MIIDTVALTKGIRAEFNKALVTGPGGRYDNAFTRAPSTAASETYGWIGQVPTLREWIGEKKVKSLEDHSYTITNKDFEGTIGVDRNEIEDDQVGIIKPRIQDLALRAKAFPSRLVSDLVAGGTTYLAYDGSAFFADRTAPNDNLLAGTGATTEALLLADLATARAAMMMFTDDVGEVMEIEGDTIICPPALEVLFARLVTSQKFTGGTTTVAEQNFWSGQIKNLIVDPRLSDENDWYLAALQYPLKPFIYQDRKKPKLIALDKEDSVENFMRKKLLYSVEMRGNAGYGYFQMCVKTVNG